MGVRRPAAATVNSLIGREDHLFRQPNFLLYLVSLTRDIIIPGPYLGSFGLPIDWTENNKQSNVR